MKISNIIENAYEGIYECKTDEFTQVLAVTRFYCGRLLNITFEHYHIDHILTGGVRARNGWHQQPRLVKKVAKKPYMTYTYTPEQIMKWGHFEDLRNAEWLEW